MVKGDMVKSRNGSYRLSRALDNPAITRFFSFKTVCAAQSSEPQARYRFVLLPQTGKTHQLRVCMRSLGSPILGDQRYGGSEHSRACLHAYAIAFTLQGRSYCIVDSSFDEALFLADGSLVKLVTKATPLDKKAPCFDEILTKTRELFSPDSL